MNIPNAVEPRKKHPADYFNWGRVRYNLKDDSGKYFNEEV